jgi:hypothetical protein
MKKRSLLLGIGLLLMLALIGCSQLTRQHTGLEEVPGGKQRSSGGTETVLAGNTITISLGESGGIHTDSTESLLTSQSVTIEADVPRFLTFSASSNIFFRVTQLGPVEADGSITLNVLYNDLSALAASESIGIRAYMVSGNGLTGQTVPQSVIPLEVREAGGTYQPLTTSNITLRSWPALFEHRSSTASALTARSTCCTPLR